MTAPISLTSTTTLTKTVGQPQAVRPTLAQIWDQFWMDLAACGTALQPPWPENSLQQPTEQEMRDWMAKVERYWGR